MDQFAIDWIRQQQQQQIPYLLHHHYHQKHVNSELMKIEMIVNLSGDPLVIFVLTILGAICAFILLLPTIPDNDNSLNTRIPSYLHMTTNSKVIASYVLGKSFYLFLLWIDNEICFSFFSRSFNGGFYSAITIVYSFRLSALLMKTMQIDYFSFVCLYWFSVLFILSFIFLSYNDNCIFFFFKKK